MTNLILIIALFSIFIYIIVTCYNTDFDEVKVIEEAKSDQDQAKKIEEKVEKKGAVASKKKTTSPKSTVKKTTKKKRQPKDRRN